MSGYHSPEEWRAVPGFEAIYEVSSWGRMRSTTQSPDEHLTARPDLQKAINW